MIRLINHVSDQENKCISKYKSLRIPVQHFKSPFYTCHFITSTKPKISIISPKTGLTELKLNSH